MSSQPSTIGLQDSSHYVLIRVWTSSIRLASHNAILAVPLTILLALTVRDARMRERAAHRLASAILCGPPPPDPTSYRCRSPSVSNPVFWVLPYRTCSACSVPAGAGRQSSAEDTAGSSHRAQSPGPSTTTYRAS